jgi:proteasome lid subunit RPN8/RPN11
VRITQEIIDEIVAHSLEDAPNECCGLIGGADGEARTVHRARNEFESPLRYNVHPADLFRINEEIEAAGDEVTGIYHSHTRSEAWPSQTDVNLATGWPDPVYLICSVVDPGEPVVRGFALRDGTIAEVELEIGAADG